MDEKYLEMAERYEQAQRDEALRKNELLNKPETHPDFDGLTCIECADDIPVGRLALGKIRCVECQSRKEK